MRSVDVVRNYTATVGEKTATPESEISESEKKLASEIENLNKDIAELKEKCGDLDVNWNFLLVKLWSIEQMIEYVFLQDKYKRSLAETENMRKRLTKQIEDAKLFGIQGFCKDLLTVSDILQKATECVPSEQLQNNPPLKNLYEGLSMTEAELQKVIHFLLLLSLKNQF